VIAEAFRRLLEQDAGLGLDHRRVRILPLPRSFKHVAARDLFAAQIAGFARDSTQKLELFVIGLELVVRDPPVLQVHIRRNGGPAVTGEGELERLVVPRQPPPGRTVPVHAGAADAFTRQERAELTHREGGFACSIAEGQRLARDVLHQFVALRVA